MRPCRRLFLQELLRKLGEAAARSFCLLRTPIGAPLARCSFATAYRLIGVDAAGDRSPVLVVLEGILLALTGKRL